MLTNFENGENYQHFCYFVKIFEFSITVVYVHERRIVYPCAKFRVDVLKMPEFGYIEVEKGQLLRYVLKFLHFPNSKVFLTWATQFV